MINLKAVVASFFIIQNTTLHTSLETNKRRNDSNHHCGISHSEFCTLILSPGVTATSFDEGMKLQDRLNESLDGVDNALSLDAKIDAMKEDGIIGYTPASGKKEKPTPGPPLSIVRKMQILKERLATQNSTKR